MPLMQGNNRTWNTYCIQVFHSAGGTATGILYRPTTVPVRSQIIECGWVPDSLMAAATVMSLGLTLYQGGMTGNSVQLISSTANGFSVESTAASVHSQEHGLVYSTIPQAPVYVQAGDAISFTTSGGDGCGVTAYAVLRPC